MELRAGQFFGSDHASWHNLSLSLEQIIHNVLNKKYTDGNLLRKLMSILTKQLFKILVN